MNYNNLAQKTNFVAGSEKLKLTSIYLTNFNIPGINFSHYETGGRAGAKLHIQSDHLVYSPLNCDILIDEDFETYIELLNIFNDAYNPENGTFSIQEFDFFIDVFNNKGNEIFKIEFFNCKLTSLGEIQLTTQDEDPTNTLNVEITFDYFKIYKMPVLKNTTTLTN